MTQAANRRLITEAAIDNWIANKILNVASAAWSALVAFFAAASPIVIAREPSGSDDTAILNALLAASPGRTVTLRSGRTYLINSASLVVPSRTTFDLNGATLDCSAMTPATALSQKFGVRADGTLGSGVAVSAALSKWSKTITGIASTAGFLPGDMILISNDEAVVPGMNLTTRDKAELNTIATVPGGGTTVTLTHGAVFAYGTTGLSIRKVTPADKVTIKNGTIKMGGVGSAHNGVQVEYGRNILLDNIHVDGAEDCSIGFKAVLNGTLKNSSAINATSQAPGPAGLGETGYGVCVWDGSRHIKVDNNYFENCRHFVAGGGIWPAVFVRVSNNAGRKALSAGFDCHEPCHYWVFSKNTVEVATHGFFVRGQYITLEGNAVSDISQEAYAVHVYNEVSEQRGVRLINNSANHSTYGISVGKASGETLEYVSYDIEIIGNKLNDCGTNPIRLRSFDGAKVSGNVIVGGTASSILIEGVDITTRSKNLTMDGNDVRGSGTHGIFVRYVDDIEAAGGQIVAPGQHGLYLLACNRSSISTKVRTPTQYGIFIDGGSAHILTGAHVSGGIGATYDSLRVDNVTGLGVAGGYYASPRYAIYTTNTTPVLVTGAYVKDAVHSTKINCDAATQTIANNMV